MSLDVCPAERTQVVNCNGAGDTLVGAVAWAHCSLGLPLAAALRIGVRAARMTVQCDYAVSPQLSADSVADLLARVK